VAGVSPASPAQSVLTMPGRYQAQGDTHSVGVVLFSVSPTAFEYPVPDGATRVLEAVSFETGSLTPVSSTPLTPAGTHLVSRFSLGGFIRFRAAPFPSSSELDLFSYDRLPFTDLTITMEFDLDAQGVLAPGTKRVAFEPAQLKPATQAAGRGASIRPGSLMYSLPLQPTGFLVAEAGLSVSSLGAQVVHSLQLEGRAGPGPSPSGSPVEAAGPPTDYPYVTAAPQYALVFDFPLGSLGALSDVASLTARLVLGWGPSRLVPGADAAAVLVQLPALSAGYGSFNLQGFLKTTFGDANLLRVELPGRSVYAVLFNNIKLSILGFPVPPGVVVDFLVFAGQPDAPGMPAATNASNVAWYLSAQQK
jgi:hypothetical protein